MLSRLKGIFFVALFILICAGETRSDENIGIGGINIGDKWSDIKEKYIFKKEALLFKNMEYFECGQFGAKTNLNGGTLSLILRNYVVCGFDFIMSIPKDADIRQLRKRMIKKYGPPDIDGEEHDSVGELKSVILTFDTPDGLLPLTIIINKEKGQYLMGTQFMGNNINFDISQKCIEELQKQKANSIIIPD